MEEGAKIEAVVRVELADDDVDVRELLDGLPPLDSVNESKEGGIHVHGVRVLSKAADRHDEGLEVELDVYCWRPGRSDEDAERDLLEWFSKAGAALGGAEARVTVLRRHAARVWTTSWGFSGEGHPETSP